MPKLDTSKVPETLVPLLPMAEKWGISDDYEREEAISQASSDELLTLVHCIDDISDQELFGWLGGPESHSAEPSAVYLAITCLTMAIDSAKAKLK